MPEVELRARPAAVVGIPGAQPRAPPAAVTVGKALPELKAGDRRQPAQMQAGQWPERRASAARASEPGAVERLPLRTARAQPNSVRGSAPAAVGAGPAWPSSPREWVRSADVIP